MLEKNFQTTLKDKKSNSKKTHHEEDAWFQTLFTENLQALITAFEERINPFKVENGKLLTIDTRELADEKGILQLLSLEDTANKMFLNFVKKVVVTPIESI